jgi:hypothetical protein
MPSPPPATRKGIDVRRLPQGYERREGVADTQPCTEVGISALSTVRLAYVTPHLPGLRALCPSTGAMP